MQESQTGITSANTPAFTAASLKQMALRQLPALHHQLWETAREAGCVILYAEDDASLHNFISQILARHNAKELTLAVHSLQAQLDIDLIIKNASQTPTPAHNSAESANAIITEADYLLADTASIAYTRLSLTGLHELYSANVNIAIANAHNVLPGIEYLLNVQADYSDKFRNLPAGIEIIIGSLINQHSYQPQSQYIIICNPAYSSSTLQQKDDNKGKTRNNTSINQRANEVEGSNTSVVPTPYKLWQSAFAGKWLSLWLQSLTVWFKTLTGTTSKAEGEAPKADITTKLKKFRFTIVKKQPDEPPQNSFKE